MKITRPLDQSNSLIKSWLELADNLSQQYEISFDDVKEKYFRNTPGNNLLLKLATTEPNMTIKEFKDVAKNLERNDIVNMLTYTQQDNILLKDIDTSSKNRYSELLYLELSIKDRTIATL